MNKTVSELLKSLIQSVTFYDDQIANNHSFNEIINNTDFINRMRLINDQYEALSESDRDEFYKVLDKEFESDIYLYIYILSFMLKEIRSGEILKKLTEVICRGKLNVYANVELELQILAEINKNYEQDALYDTQRKLHAYNRDSWSKEIQPPSEYIPYHKRNQNRIVIMSEQLLAPQHAPSKITYNLCYVLQKLMGMEVLLIACPIVTKKINTYNCWMTNTITELFNSEMNGNYAFLITEDNVYHKAYDLNDYFLINYNDCIIKGRQILFCSENSEKFKQLIEIISEFNPAFIYNLGTVSPIAEICTGFTTVVSGAMNYGFPVSSAQILLKLVKKDEADTSEPDITMLEPYHQLVIRDELQFSISPSVNPESRSMYGIAEDAFLIVIVGNRLFVDLTESFKPTLKSIFELDPRIELLLIGSFPDYQIYFSDDIFLNRIHHIEYHTHLIEVLGVADIYLNPPRNGGGTSALISLHCGVPVVTLPGGDVAGNIGGDFICNDEQDMIGTVLRYLKDDEFYERQRQAGLSITRKLTDVVAKEKEKLTKIVKAITILEDGSIDENQL